MQPTRNKLIHLLAKNKDQYISGQLLSEKLNISRSAIWKHMKELEKEGFQIEGKSRLGYRILGYPNRMNEHILQWGLETSWLGNNIIHKETTDSTQFIAHELARNNAKHGTVIIADEQTKGRGRLNRQWYSTKEQGIWLSMILRPTILPYKAPQLTLLTATVLADVIRSHIKVEPKIKWPNDLLINNKKVAGILTELQAEQDQIQYVIIGIGINVNQTDQDLPENIKREATSIQIETQTEWDLIDLIQKLLKVFEIEYEKFIESGFTNIKKKWESSGYKIGELVNIKNSRNQWQATLLGIDDDGALLTKSLDGNIEKLYSAEIDWFDEND